MADGSDRAELPMKFSEKRSVAANTAATPQPRVIQRDWRPACDGSVLKITLQGQKTLKIEASAMHHQVMIEWSVSFQNNLPHSAKYRVYDRPRLRSGDRAGEATGALLLKILQVWRAKAGAFSIVDSSLEAGLKRLLKEADEVKSKAGKEGGGEGCGQGFH